MRLREEEKHLGMWEKEEDEKKMKDKKYEIWEATRHNTENDKLTMIKATVEHTQDFSINTMTCEFMYYHLLDELLEPTNANANRSGLIFDYRDEINLYVKDTNGNNQQVFGGYISTCEVDDDLTKVTLECADRLIDLDRRYCLSEVTINNYQTGENDDYIDIPLEEKMLELLRKQVFFLEKNPHILSFLARTIFFPPFELKDRLQLVIEENKNISNMKNYYEIYHDLKKNNKIKNTITIDQFISSFDMCILRYFIGKLGLNYYKEQESIENIFNFYWEEIKSIN